MSAVAGPPSPSDSPPADAQPYIYFADTTSYKRLNLNTATVSTWTSAAGDMPLDASGNTGRLLALYRNRLVVSGLPEDPQNWFMSASGNPRNFDYDPSPSSALQAVAGNNSDAGLVGDIITALIPHGDDTLIFGGDHTIWKLSGDPAEGGRIDNISYSAGILGQDAWTRDTFGNTYIMSTNGLMRIPVGSNTPEPISAGRLDSTFRSIDRSVLRTILVWDRDREGLYIFTVTAGQPDDAPTAYWYDARTDSFWPLVFPTIIGPTAVLVFDGDAADDRALLMGGRDSFIRTPDITAKDDAVTTGVEAVESFVDIGPVHSESTAERVVVTDLQCTLSEDSDAVQLQVYAGQQPEQSIKSMTIRAVKTLLAGFNGAMRQRITAGAVRLRLYQNTLNSSWSYERGDMVVEKPGRQRRHS